MKIQNQAVRSSVVAVSLLEVETHYLASGEVVAARVPAVGEVPVGRLLKALGGNLFPAMRGGSVFTMPSRGQVRRELRIARDTCVSREADPAMRRVVIQAAARLENLLKEAATAK